jgi:hypothetical protein
MYFKKSSSRRNFRASEHSARDGEDHRHVPGAAQKTRRDQPTHSRFTVGYCTYVPLCSYVHSVFSSFVPPIGEPRTTNVLKNSYCKVFKCHLCTMRRSGSVFVSDAPAPGMTGARVPCIALRQVETSHLCPATNVRGSE